MPRNIDIKAVIPSVDAFIPKVTPLADQGPFELIQDDTFFSCKTGRLKLRVLSTGEGKLIFYRRADKKGPKESFYLHLPVSQPDVMRDLLAMSYGQTGRVHKYRLLFLTGRTRIHLDNVSGLGHFLEIEVILEENETTETGVTEAYRLLERLGIDRSQLIEGAYVDLLAKKLSTAVGT
ncbi:MULTISPECIES: class IV adenylate cyclase [unclassified Prosthecochloris]|uniref:class IV adenylate cyclase n=1 Tax=unclassified Prosthecochloris TaxID=2632826 RepID=UPI00223D0503|nr:MULTISPECIES: class IV adenylate cyclase [unclassified Prosthecochloris]UZJ37635.1 class IV adenylate cyclase [Prosthecochloris sp. SCSIO W1103]UZJ39454.1 class IV adenylate cyclase [Prosthecochloris sp. SCSIO W1102]